MSNIEELNDFKRSDVVRSDTSRKVCFQIIWRLECNKLCDRPICLQERKCVRKHNWVEQNYSTKMIEFLQAVAFHCLKIKYHKSAYFIRFWWFTNFREKSLNCPFINFNSVEFNAKHLAYSKYYRKHIESILCIVDNF